MTSPRLAQAAPEISIIIPAYNAAGTLAATFQSLLDQTLDFRRTEILIVDNASTDDSPQMMDALASRYGNVRVIRNPVSGCTGAASRNIGLDNARADYLMYLDADDAYLERCCEFLLDRIRDLGSEVVGGSHIAEASGDAVVSPMYSQIVAAPITNTTAEENPALLLLPPAICAKIYSRRFLMETGIRFDESLMVEDALFVASVLLRARTISMFPDPVFRYIRRFDPDLPSVTERPDAHFFADFCRGRALTAKEYGRWSRIDYLDLRYPMDVSYILGKYLSIGEAAPEARTAILDSLQAFFRQYPRLNMDRFSKLEEVIIKLIARGRYKEVAELDTLLAQTRARGAAPRKRRRHG